MPSSSSSSSRSSSSSSSYTTETFDITASPSMWWLPYSVILVTADAAQDDYDEDEDDEYDDYDDDDDADADADADAPDADPPPPDRSKWLPAARRQPDGAAKSRAACWPGIGGIGVLWLDKSSS
eukprot:TRINITY_DN3894_c0_g1_i1.p2 TRINITY_DN3894_c0_g1~~TRINITY_DN3894_c0_g1_i1.p2  ORF type:complete len:124 (+),score=17.88 TRINITY_DN3894_c0_g1_i1:3-374(+)